MADSIITAESESDYRAFGDLIREYVAWARLRYQDEQWFIDAVFGEQGLDDELKVLAEQYAPPLGRTLLAEDEGVVQACGAYRRFSDGICEMKRLFVSGRFQGRGLGRILCRALMAAARSDGYRIMRLDTGDRMTEAQEMYRSLGFRDCPPFHDYPAEFRPHIIFMEADLERDATRH